MAETDKKLPEHVTLPLLTRITAQSLDGDYRHVNERKVAAGKDPEGRRISRTAALVVALFGLMIVIAAVQTSREAATTEQGRQSLIREISLQREDLADSQSTISNLRDTNTKLRDDVGLLRKQQNNVRTALLRIRGYSGYAPVRGPGVRIRLDDSLDGSSDGRVRDEDLALLVNGLWVAGAEAVAINGHRLTPLSGIRSVGTAIHISAQPLRPPYDILVVGNPNTIQALFTESRPGLKWLALRNNFGFVFNMENSESEMTLPGSRRPVLRSAQIKEGDPANMKKASP